MFYKVLFMDEQNQPNDSLQDVKDIRRMMERSSRFISLSGLSGVAAGLFALVGAAIARYFILNGVHVREGGEVARVVDREFGFDSLKIQLLGLAAGVFAAAFLSAFYFTWKKTSQQGLSLWNPTSRRLFWNMIIPLASGALFILGMLQYKHWDFVAPASLIFYGLALVNASKYTFSDIRYLGLCEIVTGLVNMEFTGYGLYFWAFGFGVLHIIYGITMWWKYERNGEGLK